MEEARKLMGELLFIRDEDSELYREIVRKNLGCAELLRIYKKVKERKEVSYGNFS